MLSTRREFATQTTAGLIARSLIRSVDHESADVQPLRNIEAVAFDAFPIFDPTPVFQLADHLFPGAGLSGEWRTRQFEYCWLRAASHHYEDFWRVTEQALIYAGNKLGLTISAGSRATLMNGYLSLNPWQDVVPALEQLKRAGLKLALLSNLTPVMLEINTSLAGLAGTFDEVVSTDRAKTYKPDPRAYQLGIDALRVARERILFVASAGWDAAGARVFGYPTFWINRQRLPAEELGVRADATGGSLRELVTFLS